MAASFSSTVILSTGRLIATCSSSTAPFAGGPMSEAFSPFSPLLCHLYRTLVKDKSEAPSAER